SLEARHLRQAARELQAGADAVFIPATDGGYILVGLRRPWQVLFTDMAWSTPTVMSVTRDRARAAGLRVRELAPLPDLDLPADLERLSSTEAAALGLARRGRSVIERAAAARTLPGRAAEAVLGHPDRPPLEPGRIDL